MLRKSEVAEETEMGTHQRVWENGCLPLIPQHSYRWSSLPEETNDPVNGESFSLTRPPFFLLCKLVPKRHRPLSLTGAPVPGPFLSRTPSCWQWMGRVEKEAQLTKPASIVWQLTFYVPKRPCLLARLGGDQRASRSQAPKVSHLLYRLNLLF